MPVPPPWQESYAATRRHFEALTAAFVEILLCFAGNVADDALRLALAHQALTEELLHPEANRDAARLLAAQAHFEALVQDILNRGGDPAAGRAVLAAHESLLAVKARLAALCGEFPELAAEWAEDSRPAAARGGATLQERGVRFLH